MIISNEIDMSNTMYPSFAQKVTGTETFIVPVLSTVYGYVLKGTLEFENGNNVQSGQYFSLWSQTTSDIKFKVCKSMIMFYLRWERDNDKLESLKLPKECLKIIKNNLDTIANIDDFNESRLAGLVKQFSDKKFIFAFESSQY